MRLFLAIELSPNVREHLRHLQQDLAHRIDEHWRGKPRRPKISWTKPENLHVTLKFLGEVPDARVPALCDAMKSAPLEAAFNLRTAGVHHFPPRGPINVIVSSLEGDLAAARRLAAEIESACEPCGFAKESRPFTPHVTIGRAKQTMTAREWEALELPPAAPGEMFPVSRVVLMQSDLRRDGPVYAPVATFPLSQPGMPGERASPPAAHREERRNSK